MVPGLAKSTQCVPAGKPCKSSGSALGGMRSSLDMNLKVDAGAMILGCVALRPMEGEKGACKVDLSVRWVAYQEGTGRIAREVPY